MGILTELCKRSTVDLKTGTVMFSLEAFVKYVETVLGPGDEFTISWKSKLEESIMEKEQIHQENKAWDDWKDSLFKDKS